MRFISRPGNWALLIDLNYCEATPIGRGRIPHPGRDSRFIGRQDNTELIVEIDHGDKEEYHVDGSVGVLRWEHERRRKYMRDAKLRAFIETFYPRVPKDKTYDKWYAESGPFKQKMPEEEPLEEIEDQTIDWEFSDLSYWEDTFDYEND